MISKKNKYDKISKFNSLAKFLKQNLINEYKLIQYLK